MRALYALLTALTMPIAILNMFGGIGAGIWLIYLGMWKPIWASLLILFTGPLLLSFAMMPALVLALPAAKAAEYGKAGLAIFVGALSMLYTSMLTGIWSYAILKGYSGMGPTSAQWPLLLLSYGAATGPWAYMASKEQQASQDNVSQSALHVFFISIGYIAAAGSRLIGAASFETCFWIIAGTMFLGWIFQVTATAADQRLRSTHGL